MTAAWMTPAGSDRTEAVGLLLCVNAGGPDRFARRARAAVGARPDRPVLTLDIGPAGWNQTELEAFLADFPSSRLICLGFGPAGAAALRLADMLDAPAFAVAPDLATGDLTMAAPARVILRLSEEPGAPALLHPVPTGLSPDTLVGALDQCGWLEAVLAALTGEGPLPPLARLRQTWQTRFTYRIEVDCSQLVHDASNSLRLAGRVVHQGTEPLALLADAAALVRIGARVLDEQGRPIPGLEGRCAFPTPFFHPGQQVPFQITLPRFDPAEGDAQIMVSLVCDGAYWFSDAGFAACYLAADRPGPSSLVLARPVPASPAPDAASTVQLLHRALTGREADPADLAHYSRLLNSGALDEQGLARTLSGPNNRAEPDKVATPGGAMSKDISSLGSQPLVRVDGLVFPLSDETGPADAPALPDDFIAPALPYFLDDCTPGAVVLDVGAGCGVFSLPAARRIGSGGQVYALEPNPRAFQRLVRTLALNALGNVDLLPLGAADRVSHTGQRETERRPPRHRTCTGAEALQCCGTAPLLPLDLLRPRLRPVDLLRIGVAGEAYSIVCGALALLRADRPRVFLRYHPGHERRLSGVSGASLLTIFRNLGYGFDILRPGRGRERLRGPNPIIAIDQAWQAAGQVGDEPLELCLFPLDPSPCQSNGRRR